MDTLEQFVATSHPIVTFITFGTASFFLYVGYLLVRYPGRAAYTSARPDLDTIAGGVPLLGNLPRGLRDSATQLEYWHTLRREQVDKSKPLSVTIPGLRVIDITRPSFIEYVQRTNHTNFVKGSRLAKNFEDVLGTGIFAADGANWHVQRKTTSKIFNGNNFRGIITSSISHDLKKLSQIIGRHADSGEPFDLSALFFRFTLSSFSAMAFGQDLGILGDSDAPVPFAVAFDYAQGVMTRRFMNPAWPIWQHFNGEGRKMKSAVKQMDDFAYDIITQREKEGLGNFAAGVDKKEVASTDLLSLYMKVRDDNGQPLSKKALRDAVLNLIIAGRDTTAQGLSWTFFHLLRNPDHYRKMQQEVDESGVIDYDSFKTLIQTNAAFTEGLRLHPSVPKNGWICLADDQIPGGPRVEKGDLVRWSDWEMGRMEEIWGPDAMEYKPQRWIDEKGELIKESNFKAHMFNGGARLCLGKDLANYEAVAVMATILEDFDLAYAPGYIENVEMVTIEDTPRYQESLTLPMKDPFLVKATRRTGKA